MLAPLYYILASVLLGYYGGEVCPFMAGLDATTIMRNVALGFAVALVIRRALTAYIDRAPPFAISRRQLLVDLALFTGVGGGLGVVHAGLYDFPVESGAKLVLGCLAVGWFASIDMGLVRERSTPTGAPPEQVSWSRSLPGRIIIVTVVGLLLTGGVLALLVGKDFAWLAENPGTDLAVARAEAVWEVSFVAAVVLALAIRVVFSLAHNLELYLGRETEAMQAVAAGNLDVHVPVVSDDEFGVIAHHTNTMIAGLRERARVKDLFGKVVSPEVARRLLDRDGDLLGGSRQTLVILMSDLRGFTARAEKRSPERVVEELNAYFSRMVSVVHSHGGVVDKFIGDGMLAVFGLTDAPNAARQAVTAARAMCASLAELNGDRADPLCVGIGVHQGEVVAGAIGAPDRLEFTVIGDAVNIAARLEALTKTVAAQVAISAAVFQALDDQERAAWRDLGEHALKGREAKVRVYGA